MKKFLLYILVSFCSFASIAAEDYFTIIHHKDGRVFALKSNQISSISHTRDDIDASYYDLTDSIVYPPHMNAIMNILAQASAGVSISTLSKEENLNDLFEYNADFEHDGEQWTHAGIFSFIDDDVMDQFIPSSHAGQYIKGTDKTVGGYFSLLYPFFKSLEVKYGIPLTCGLAVEGHRVGLTEYGTPSDNCAINENGRLVQQLVTHAHWECLCHSMTARISPDGSIYLVDSLNSEDALDILKNGKWGGAYSFYTAGVYDKQTKKNYTISSDRSKWNETPYKYIQPFYYDKKTKEWIYNESYPIDYQVGEWKRRADSIGFIHEDIIVHWGQTAAAPIIRKCRPYFSHSFGPVMNNSINHVPLTATIHRISTITGDNNVYNANRYNLLKNAIDETVESNGWLVLMNHFYLVNYYNGYLDGIAYPEREENYNPEWINPLVTEEIRSMNENNYWDNPPTRLGISNWGEWRPAKGTQLWGLYRIIEYAIQKGLQNVSPSEGIKIIGTK